jgi:hypothetical protein
MIFYDYFKKLIVKGYWYNSPSLAFKLALIINTISRMKQMMANTPKPPVKYNRGEG